MISKRSWFPWAMLRCRAAPAPLSPCRSTLSSVLAARRRFPAEFFSSWFSWMLRLPPPLVAAVGCPSGSALCVVGGVAGSDIRAGDYLAAVNNARRFSSPRQAETIISNSRALELLVRLVFIRSPSTPPFSDTPKLAEDTVIILPYTGAVFGELTFLGELPAPSLGASSLDGDTALANGVLICPRDECGRHAARQAGDPAGPNLYCCIPCAQLEGHSARCSRVYSQRALLGEPTGPPPGDDAHPRGPDRTEVGAFGARWQSGAVGASATGAPVGDVVVDTSSPLCARVKLAPVCHHIYWYSHLGSHYTLFLSLPALLSWLHHR